MRSIETREYWQSKFSITEDDVNYLYEVLVEEGIPCPIERLARAVMEHRQRMEENARTQQMLEQGIFYQPKRNYIVGQRVLFPRLRDISGTVIAIRPGENPEYGEFDVIRVELSGNGIREFAARFMHPHPLNEDEAHTSIDHLYAQYGRYIKRPLKLALEKHHEFIEVGDQWFLVDLLPEVHIGHLNIAEAVIDLAEMPLPTEAILKQVDLPTETPIAIQTFALNYALSQDPRFNNIGDDHVPVWALIRKQAPEAVSP
jgi:hypothetical protein